MREHQWSTVSTHRSAEGLVRYQRCRCGRWRTLQGAEVLAAPVATCRPLGRAA
ncbi:hypothetical protein ACFPK1_07270 [Actinomycetospora rhizophila]|uniref:Uncharacterized protein n=1 Tax=Actinomycetospora rhizophila TaxID=1416876 RepID=A0ABV9ZAL1_9PSEU